MYDLRSTIAHGGELPAQTKVGDETLDLGQAAQKACEMLRTLITHFLPHGGNPPYKKQEYWDKGLFGLPRSE